jgi:hypothetical protein
LQGVANAEVGLLEMQKLEDGAERETHSGRRREIFRGAEVVTNLLTVTLVFAVA